MQVLKRMANLEFGDTKKATTATWNRMTKNYTSPLALSIVTRTPPS